MTRDSGADAAQSTPVDSQPDIDALLVASTVRWALAVSALMALYMVSVFAGYPMPSLLEGARTVAYVVAGAALVVAALAITFIAYRMVAFRVVRGSRSVYALFLPAAMLVASIVAILLVAAPD